MAPRKKPNKKHLLVRFKRRTRLLYLRLMRINDPPERIARGAAIGVCMGILPTFGAGTILSFAVAFIFKANKAAAIIGSFIMNPVTSTFFWTFSIVLGGIILGADTSTILANFKNDRLIESISGVYLIFLTGNVIITSAFTVTTYFVVKKGIIKHRRRKEERRKRRKAARKR